MSSRADLTPSLLVELRAGGPAAGERFQRLFRERLVGFCQGYLGRRDEAEDAASDVTLKVLASRDLPDDVCVWMFRIARNNCLNRLRDRAPRRHEPLPSELDVAARTTGPVTALARADDRAALARALERLTPHERELLRLRYGEDLSREEIASLLELPGSVVKSRLYEAVAKLRADSPP